MIPRDKILHFVAGLLIGLSALFIPTCYAFGLVVIAGIGKEIKDQIVYRGFDIYDFWYTLAGGVVSVGLIEIFSLGGITCI
jgi:hypothetical protein